MPRQLCLTTDVYNIDNGQAENTLILGQIFRSNIIRKKSIPKTQIFEGILRFAIGACYEWMWPYTTVIRRINSPILAHKPLGLDLN